MRFRFASAVRRPGLCGSRLQPRLQAADVHAALASDSLRWCAVLACALVSLLAASCGSAQRATASPQQANPLELIAEWGVKGEGPGELAEPVGLAVDLNDRVYLADRRSGLLQKFEPTGVPSLLSITQR